MGVSVRLDPSQRGRTGGPQLLGSPVSLQGGADVSILAGTVEKRVALQLGLLGGSAKTELGHFCFFYPFLEP